MALPEFTIDGNWVDIGSLITGLFYVLFTRIRARNIKKIITRQTGLDFASGAALFPLIIMTGSVVSSFFIQSLIEASKISLSVAGFFALLAILEDRESEK